MVADTVGYSKMMEADEQATLAAFSELRQSVVEPTVKQSQGDIIKRTGDGWLVEFASVLDAVSCAIGIQEKLRLHGTLKLRIGIHLGDIVHDDDGDIFGDGVNVAARLESIAPAGSLAISDQVYNALDDTKKAAFEGGKERELKNISRPIRVWAWQGASTQTMLPNGPIGAVFPTILLEPLGCGGDENLAADLALEIQSGLEHAISKRSGIKVSTSHNSKNPPTYRLHGRCRAFGNRCRVHISISACNSGETCWSTKVDGELDDLFGFVDDIVWQVGAAIRVQLNAHAGEGYSHLPDGELTEQQLLSKAAFHMHQFDPRSMAIAKASMAAAVELEPNNPMALAMHSYALMQSVPLAMNSEEDVDADEVLSIADKAVEMGPKVDYAFHNRARIRLWLRRDHQGCRQDAKRALIINPGFHFAKEDLALADIFGGSVAARLESLSSIVQNFPDHPTTPYRLSILSLGYTMLGDTKSALTLALDAYERKSIIRLHPLAYAAAAAGNTAITGSNEFQKIVEDHGLRVLDANRFPFADEATSARLASILREAGLPE
ncbi:adenylate/guanylate cyclase domain-containing protein [Ruegeria sp. HKCCA5014]|uniref:adenylate/guanylate cyclase domain-containing protein n=1 Tax=Ruegeria sp. HKCCA5014 TaxID=2682980 RepID=UPI00148761D4|nr:adenylate/guanylate cyclase domain-containing protein [Ruegeria sp. HKCCA5014]